MIRMNVLLTGGTGFVGGFLAAELLKAGHFVTFLARANKHLSAEKRVQAVLKFVAPELHRSFGPVCRVLEGDITKEDLGLSAQDEKYLLRNRPGMVLHGAASVDFAKNNGHATEMINVDGTRNVLTLAGKLGVKRFGYLSTLYVAGNRKGTILETELDRGQTFNNVYEETKLMAEILVRRWHKMTGIPFSIYRLPVVIGSSTTGKTLPYTGFDGFFKAFWGLARSIQRRMEKDHRPGDAGVHMSERQLSVPLFVKCTSHSRIHLAPVDWVAHTITSLCVRESENRVFHLTQPDMPSSWDIIEKALPILGLRGLRFIEPDEEDAGPLHDHPILNGYQRMVDSIVGQYLPYTMNSKAFDNANLRNVLGEAYTSPPEIDRDMLETILAYAINTEFKPPSFPSPEC